MEERKKLTAMLRDFQAEQKELLAQAEQRHEVCFCPFVIRTKSLEHDRLIFYLFSRNITRNC